MKPSSLIAVFNRLPVWRLRVRVWDFSLAAPTFDRWLYLWMHRLGRMGREEADFFRQVIRPGMHVADVGANLGLYSLLLARGTGPTGRVYAFEPDALMAGALRRNLAANGAAHAEVFECAVGAAPGSAVLQRNAMNSGDNRLGTTTGTALHSEQNAVPVCALQDALRGRRLDFIKMDVQGWEGEALRGVGELLDANPGLQIYFEFWPHGLRLAGTEIAQLAATLAQLRLHVTLAGSGGQSEAVDLLALDRRMAPKAFTNLLATRR
jgi:FkbM family methyltransferase